MIKNLNAEGIKSVFEILFSEKNLKKSASISSICLICVLKKVKPIIAEL